MQDELEGALAHGHFELHYQPQFSADGERMVGAEALARLRSVSGELLYPGAFIPTIESSPFVHEFGARVFAQACTDALRWPGLIVAVNVSPLQFRDPDLVSRLVEISDRAGTDRERIEIEITEGLFFDDPARAEAMLHEVRDAGFKVALDDFGTGYSSLAYLLRFPVDKIKIDRSFVTGVNDSLKSAAIVHALIALARAIGLKVVAEGVETADQQRFLRAAGCHVLQGFLFSPAVPASAIDRMREPASLRLAV